MLYGTVVVEGEAGAVTDRFIGTQIINSPYPTTGPPVCLHGRRAERLDPRARAVRATDECLGKLLQPGGSRADAGNGALEPVAMCMAPRYGTVEPFRPPRETEHAGLCCWSRSVA